MANKTAIQLATTSGIADDDLLIVYDNSEQNAEKLKAIQGMNARDNYFQVGLAKEYHTHTEADITNLDKYTQAQVNSLLNTTSGTLQSEIDINKAQTASALSGKQDTGDYALNSRVTSVSDDFQIQLSTLSGTLQGEVDTKTGADYKYSDLYYNDNLKIESTADVKFYASILPDMTTGASGTVSAYDIGSATAKFRNLYVHDAHIDAQSLFVNNKKVIEDVSDIITVSTEIDNDIRVKTTGQGIVYIDSGDELDISAVGGIQAEVPSTSPTKHINFTNSSTGGNITFTTAGSTSQIQFNAVKEIDFTAPTFSFAGNFDMSNATLSHHDLTNLSTGDDHPQYFQKSGGTINGDMIVYGNFTVSGTTFYTQTQTVEITDNELLINNGEQGNGVTAGEAGIEVDRGTATNYKFIFSEATDNFRIGETGSLQAVATREDTPTSNFIPVWDSENFMFSTASGIDSSKVWTSDNDGSGSGLDADKLDGIDSSGFVSTTSDSTMEGMLTATTMRVRDSGGQLTGTLEVGNTPTGINPMMYNGYLYASKVYDAVWNDIADFQELAGEHIAGKCYYDTPSGALVCDTRCQKGVIGILSDTYGFGVGAREDINYAPFAVCGWVLAYVNGTPEIGDALTSDIDGNLVVMTPSEKSSYPERIVATYKKPETSETWGPDGQQISVNGRHWVKVK